MNTHKLEAGPVREAVRGRWVPVLQALVPELEAALAKPGRHVSCPVHGGRDGFRLFKDVETSGGGICNTCGASPDTFFVFNKSFMGIRLTPNDKWFRKFSQHKVFMQ